MNINGYELVLTCGACPEQYDVFLNDEQVGYLRLRHGYFYAATPDVGGTVVYEARPEGDGIFEQHEREYHLTKAIEAIHLDKTTARCFVCGGALENNKYIFCSVTCVDEDAEYANQNLLDHYVGMINSGESA